MTSVDYRERMYGRYVTSRGEETPTSLGNRAPYLEWFVSEHLPADRDAVILDVGCGYGALLHFARQAGYRSVRGIDVSAEQVAAAKRLGIEGVSQGDLVESLQALPECSQDLVVAFDVIEHFTKNEVLDFVDAVHRVLKADGRFVLHAPNAESPLFGRIRYGDFTHELAFTRDSMSQLLQASGFRDVSCFETVPVVHGMRSRLRLWVWKLIRAMLWTYLAAETGDTRPALFSQGFLTVASKSAEGA